MAISHIPHTSLLMKGKEWFAGFIFVKILIYHICKTDYKIKQYRHSLHIGMVIYIGILFEVRFPGCEGVEAGSVSVGWEVAWIILALGWSTSLSAASGIVYVKLPSSV